MPVYTSSLSPEQMGEALLLYDLLKSWDMQKLAEKDGARAAFTWLAMRDLIKEHPEIGDMTDVLFANFLRDEYGPCKCDPPYSAEEFCTGDCRWDENGQIREDFGG